MRILVIEDDPPTTKALEMILKHSDICVDSTDLGKMGVELGKVHDYSLILLDISLPDIGGHEVLCELRAANVNTPVLILSGADNPVSKLKSFECGADDYLTKPFHCDELIARIHAIIRRSKAISYTVIQTGVIAVNLEEKSVDISGIPLSLTPKEYAILELLCLRKGTTLTKKMILNHVYCGLDEPELKIVDVMICKLRKKLRKASGQNGIIQTVWGRGYTLGDSEKELVAI